MVHHPTNVDDIDRLLNISLGPVVPTGGSIGSRVVSVLDSGAEVPGSNLSGDAVG